MSIKRITLSVPTEVARRIKKAAGTKPVSAWITEVALEHLDEAEYERRWQEFVAEVKPRVKDARDVDAMLKRFRQKRGSAA